MGYRELFLVVSSVFLFSLMMVQINTNLIQGREVLQEAEIAHTAISVAQQFIEEAKSKKFDAKVDTLNPGDMPTQFTPWYALGHAAGESYPNFNDVDDYHNFSDTLFVYGMDFIVNIDVCYVQDSNPEQKVKTETFFKKMAVSVSSSWLDNPLTLKHIFSYYGISN